MSYHFRQAVPEDARAISELVLKLAEPFFVNPDHSEAAVFLDSISADSERLYLQDPRYWFWLAEAALSAAGSSFFLPRNNKRWFAG